MLRLANKTIAVRAGATVLDFGVGSGLGVGVGVGLGLPFLADHVAEVGLNGTMGTSTGAELRRGLKVDEAVKEEEQPPLGGSGW